MDDEFKTLEKYIQDSEERFNNRRRLRESNQQDNIEYPNENSLSKLDSSIKKNSAFVKKLKTFNESQKEQILLELDRLNLSKFISEIASSIIETKFKLNDIPALLEVSTKLNQNYREFGKSLLEQYAKYFPTINKKRSNELNSLGVGGVSASSNSTSINLSNSNLNNASHTSTLVINSNKIQSSKNNNETQISLNPNKIRLDLRLFAEFVIHGIFPLKDGLTILMNLLFYLMVYDRINHQNISAILTFCKSCGDEFLGLVPDDIQSLAKKYEKPLPTSDLLPLKRQELLKSYVCDYYKLAVKHLNQLSEELNELINKNKRVYKAKGEISKELKESVDSKHVEFQKIHGLLIQLAELLGTTSPLFPDLNNATEQHSPTENSNLVENNQSCDKSVNVSLWDDDGSRGFYEDLVDLKTIFPNLTIKVTASVKKLSTETVVQDKASEEIATTNNLKRIDGDAQSNSDQNEENIGVEDAAAAATASMATSDQLKHDENDSDSSSSDESSLACDTSSTKSATPLVMTQAAANRVQPDQFYAKLSNCVNRDMIDNAAIDFIKFFNTKFGRKKLVKTLFNVQRTRLDLLPFFARLTATLYPYAPTIGNELVGLLKQDFRSLFRKKDQINIESKVKNVRFIGELVKFDLYPKQEALNCLKMLLSDFTHHHIEMTCNLLETCGRLLYKSRDSHHQLKLLLEQMMRKKLLLSVDSKYVTMIENAYYFTNPPEIVKKVVKDPPIHVHVRYLLHECLNRSTIDTVLQKIKSLDWEDKSLTKFVINCMIEAHNLKFYNIRYLAALLAALNKEFPWISIAVVDGVVEDILLMMEVNEQQFNQRRIPMIRYFGELYNYKLSDSSLVFKILYSLITYGVYYSEPGQRLNEIPMSQLDLPDNLFRIKLVCDLLETCGQYLSSGQDKKKLDCYLLFFQRYYWFKKHVYLLHPYCLAKNSNQFPASIEYLYNDAILNLRPSFPMVASYSQAVQSVQSFIDNIIV